MAGLTHKRQVFLEEYLRCWNATEAARRAGYATPRQEGARLLSDAVISKAIEERIKEKAMSADEVLLRLADHGRGDMADFLRIERVEYHDRYPVAAPTEDDPLAVRWVEDPIPREQLIVQLDLEAARDRGLLHLIKEIHWDRWGQPKIALYEAQAALKLLGNHHRLFVDRHEVTGKDGEPIVIEDARTKLARMLARRLSADEQAPVGPGDPGADAG